MARPTVVFDGDCGFCRFWIERWRAATRDRVEYVPYQDAAARFPDVPADAFAQAVYLIEFGRNSRGAEAAFRALSYSPQRRWRVGLFLYERWTFFASISERVYSFIAARRPFFSRLTKLLWGPSPLPHPVSGTRRAVLIGLGLCYLAAFASLGIQARGLLGSQGISLAPGFSDATLIGACVAGSVSALALLLDFMPGPAALAAWVLYLLLSAAAGEFLNFQWDALLLETGLIAVFLGKPSKTALFLMRLLLVKLMLQSGLVKLLSGDANWRSLEALRYHYWTQPLPTPLSWWMNQLPLAVQKACCATALSIELGSSLLLLGPRRMRFLGVGLIVFLMTMITLTGNYGFFTFLTAALSFSALDDDVLGLARLSQGKQSPPGFIRSWLINAFAMLWLYASAVGFFIGTLGRPVPGTALFWSLAPLRSINNYGLFAVMTTERHEIVIEVSENGRDWREWPFRWKPGDPHRAPPFLPFYMPRLDWQMWFAALGPAQISPWLENFFYRLLTGSESVKTLMGPDTLDGRRPAFIRAVFYAYTFATAEEHRAGFWWHRERLGLYFPAVTLGKTQK